MTREQAIELLRFTKVYVKDKSREIQQKAFELGFRWIYSGQEICHTDAPFIFFSMSGSTINSCCNIEVYNSDIRKEITAEEILAITIEDEPKPTYRPFKNADECWNEMQKHQPLGWVKETYRESPAFMALTCFRDIEIETQSKIYFYEEALKMITFADGAPFGIKEK